MVGGGIWALFQSLPGPSFTSDLGWSKSLSNVAEYCYQICLKTSKKVEGSLSKLLCMSSG